jgi:hypothetical protein
MKLRRKVLPLVLPGLCLVGLAQAEPGFKKQALFTLELGYTRAYLSSTCNGCEEPSVLKVSTTIPTLDLFYNTPLLRLKTEPAHFLKSMLAGNNSSAVAWIRKSKEYIQESQSTGTPIGLYISAPNADKVAKQKLTPAYVDTLKEKIQQDSLLGADHLERLDQSGCFKAAHLADFQSCSLRIILSDALGYSFEEASTLMEPDIQAINEASDIVAVESKSRSMNHLILHTSTYALPFYQEDRKTLPVPPNTWMRAPGFTGPAGKHGITGDGGTFAAGFRLTEKYIADPIGTADIAAVPAGTVSSQIASGNTTLDVFYKSFEGFVHSKNGFAPPLTTESVFSALYTGRAKGVPSGKGYEGIGEFLYNVFSLPKPKNYSKKTIDSGTFDQAVPELQKILEDTRAAAALNVLFTAGLLGPRLADDADLLILGDLADKTMRLNKVTFKQLLSDLATDDEFKADAYSKYQKLSPKSYTMYDKSGQARDPAQSVYMAPGMTEVQFNTWLTATITRLASGRVSHLSFKEYPVTMNQAYMRRYSKWLDGQ